MADLVKELMLDTLPRASFLFLFFAFLLFLHYYWLTAKTRKKQQREIRLPPSPPALPIIGHLHLVGSLPHVSLGSLARKYGPDVMLLRLGAVPTLVVSSARAAEAVLRTHDHVFASRPRSVVADIIMYGSSDIAFAPYGEYWRQARKLVTTHVLSVKKVQSFRRAATEQDVFFGATETSSNALEFTLAELMRRPRLMEKLQDEVRSNVPRGQGILSENDINNMTYLRAVIKESFRLHPVAPLLAPHLAMADCSIDGYMVHAGTRVVVNAWAIGRDPTSWEDAEEFIPERFVEGGSDVRVNFKGNDFQFLPFGAGRRICPGINLGIANVELMLANLIYHFDWELPLGVERTDVDMTEVFGLTVHRKEKLLLIPKARM